MKLANVFKGGVLIAAVFTAASQLRAQNYQTYTFAGAGTNGVTASGSMTVNADDLVDTYASLGGIYSQGITVTIDNIPGIGPNSVTFSGTDADNTYLTVVGSTIYVGAYGSHNFGSPGFDHYDLGQPSGLPFTTTLSYDGGATLSTITWSSATLAAIPEPSTYAALAGLAALGLVMLRRRAAA